jgi:hypothetical protein
MQIVADLTFGDGQEPFDLVLVGSSGGLPLRTCGSCHDKLALDRDAAIDCLPLDLRGRVRSRTRGSARRAPGDDAFALGSEGRRVLPSSQIEPDLICVRDGSVVPLVVTTAGIDHALALVRGYGPKVAVAVAKRLEVADQRQRGQSRFSPRRQPSSWNKGFLLEGHLPGSKRKVRAQPVSAATRAAKDFVRERRTAVPIRRIVSVVRSGARLLNTDEPTDKSL